MVRGVEPGAKLRVGAVYADEMRNRDQLRLCLVRGAVPERPHGDEMIVWEGEHRVVEDGWEQGGRTGDTQYNAICRS